jgi:hypothetical protein
LCRYTAQLQIAGVCGCILAAAAMGASGDTNTRGALLFGIPTAGGKEGGAVLPRAVPRAFDRKLTPDFESEPNSFQTNTVYAYTVEPTLFVLPFNVVFLFRELYETGAHVPRDAALGTAFMLLNTFASAVQVVWQRRLMDTGFSPERLNAVMTGVATAWLAPPALALAHNLKDWTPTVGLYKGC